MVTPDELRSLQLANARADEAQWRALSDISEARAAGSQVLAAEAERAADVAKETAERATVAQQRVEALERTVAGGLRKPKKTSIAS